MSNILILSCGTRNKLIQYFRKALSGNGNVVAVDMSELAPALYEADKHYIVPPMIADEYIDIIYGICINENITGVLSLIDPELSLLAAHEEDFRNIGTTVVGSSYELCERCFDKFAMYQWLVECGYRAARSYRNWDSFMVSGLVYPVFIKPVKGSASIGIFKANNEETAKFLFHQRDEMMVQEYMSGQEIGVDAYIDLISGEVVSIFMKKKIAMRAGETDKAVSFKDNRLFDLVEQFCADSGFRGPVDMDIFNNNGEYYICEINPRFGGGYPHAHACGCNHIELLINNINGKSNHRSIGGYKENVYLMKYNEIMIR